MIQIDELLITMPGNNQQDGTELGRLVVEKLAAVIPENCSNQHIPSLNLQLQSASSNNVSLMADQIVEEIMKQITLSTY